MRFDLDRRDRGRSSSRDERAEELVAASGRRRRELVEDREIRSVAPRRHPVDVGACRTKESPRVHHRSARFRAERHQPAANASRHTSSNRSAYRAVVRRAGRWPGPLLRALSHEPGRRAADSPCAPARPGQPVALSMMFPPSRNSSGAQRPRVLERTTARPVAMACNVTLWPDGCGTSLTGTTTTEALR